MKPEYSLKYGEKEYTFAVENGKVYELEKGVTVTIVAKEYKEYDALEWVLFFENTSGKDSQIFSNICDCNTLLPIEYPNVPKAGCMPKYGDACIITMTGMVDGFNYWENDKVSSTEYNFNYEYLDKTTASSALVIVARGLILL